MKKIKFLILVTLLITLISNAQIRKGNWMTGGNLSFSNSVNYKNDSHEINSKSTFINISPNVGYFIFDKLSIGTIYQYSSNNVKFEDSKQITKSSYIGPFVRYYILKPDKVANIFLETSYNFSTLKNNKTVFNTKVGFVYFLNSAVGLELTLNYSIIKNRFNNDLFSNSTSKNLTLGLGFQIHLEKE